MKPEAREFMAERIGAVFKPESAQPIYEWARESGITMDASSPIAGAYRIENSPWAREWFFAFQADEVRMVTTVGPNQGGRTKAMEIAAMWAIVHRGGPTQWNGYVEKKAKDQAEDRWQPMMKTCREIVAKMPTHGTGYGRGRHSERIQKTTFTDGSHFEMQGCTESNLEEKSILTQFNDECWQWPGGAMNNAHIRCDVAFAWNYKIWNGSVAGVQGDDLEAFFLAGTQEELHWHCPFCKRRQIPKWGNNPNEKGGIKFKRILFPDKEYNYEAIKKTVFYECEHCGKHFEDTNKMRRLLLKGAKYYSMNPNAAKWHRSFRFNILSVNWPGITWGKWVEEFLKATEAWRKYHNMELLKTFWRKRMAQFWEENKFLNSQRRVVISDYNLGEPNFYIKNKWVKDGATETIRFMGADKQMDYYVAVIRAVMANGESRLVWFGNLDSYAEIDAKAKEFNVINNCVLLDFGYEIKDCAAAAVKYGWTGMKGVDREQMFLHNTATIENGKHIVKRIERPWSEMKFQDPLSGETGQVLNTRIPLQIRQRNIARYFQWMNLPIKDMLAGFKQGSALYYGIPGDVGSEYRKQINAEVRHKIVNAKGRPSFWWSNRNAKGGGQARRNEAWDCECEILVAMCQHGVIDLSQWNLDAKEDAA